MHWLPLARSQHKTALNACAHGTGTPVGDPIEAHALGAVLCCERANGNQCIIGSVKTNIGHLEAGAGIAGLIKVALMLRHRMIPPHLHLVTPNPTIEFAKLKLPLPRALKPLPTRRVFAPLN